MFISFFNNKKSAKRILAISIILALMSSLLPYSSFQKINWAEAAWTDTGGGDHEGANWTPANGLTIAGTHTNIETFTISSGYTVNVDSSLHSVEIHASTIVVEGIFNANGAGGAGGIKDVTTNGSGWLGADGVGPTDKGGTGGNGGTGYNSGDVGGTGTANAGGGGGGGSYVSTGDPGGNGGAYGGGGGSGGVYSSTTYYGGAGGNGGGKVILYAGNINISGTINANGLVGSNGNVGGGGAGGGGGNIYLYGGSVTGGTLNTNGGAGGKDIYSTDGTYGGGGGGAGGGYIYIGYTGSYTAGTYSVSGGAGGYARGGSYAQPGSAGTDGSVLVELLNLAPTATAVTDLPDPLLAGNDIQFSVDWSDPDSGDLEKIHICKTNAITGQICDGGSWCDSSSFTTDNPMACGYTTQAGDAGANNYYAFVCDDSNSCSSSIQGDFTVTTNNIPSAPGSIYTNASINPTDVTNSSPTLSAEYDDLDASDTASFYEIQVVADGGDWASPYWDSTKKVCSVSEGDRLQVTYNGSALNLSQQKYYQRWKFWDSTDEGEWSDGLDYFITATPKNEYGANVRGYAWSDDIGWLSFNSRDMTSFVASYNSGTGGLEGWGWADNIGWISLDCASDTSCNPVTADHAVVVDGSGDISGDAWSDNLGWLSFDRMATGNPPGDPYQASGAIAHYDSVTKEFSGWARFLTAPEGDWDGWIKLRCYGAECDVDGWTDGTGTMSGVFVDESGYLEGWAWGSDVVGWIGFKGPGDVDYGVVVDEATNKLSGHAWSDNLGWISFDRDETGTPPSDDTCVDESCVARLKTDNYQVDGWARVLSYGDGWDGWISLNKKTGDSFDYEVSLNTDTKEFEGWAYGSDVIGWVSFNHLTDGSGVDYNVYTGLLLGIQPTDPHDTWSLCADALHPTLNWDVSGVTNGYEMEIYSDADLNNLVYQYQALDTSSVSHYANSDAGVCHIGSNGFQNSSTCDLSYLGHYWWRVRVRNTDNVWGQWSTTDNFTITSSHQWPGAALTTNPTSPQLGSITHFLDQSITYGGSTAAVWQWGLSGVADTDYQYENSTSSADQNPDIMFLTNTAETVSLQVIDSDGYGPCSCSESVSITSSNVKWKEVTPTP